MNIRLIQLMQLLLDIYSLAILLRALLPWFRVSPYHPVMEFLYRITEPVLAPLRRYIPPTGGLDFTPMVAMLLIFLVRSMLDVFIRAILL